MIEFVEGRLVEKTADGAVVQVAGVGLFMYLSAFSLQKLAPVGRKVRLYTHLAVKEDGFQLYGFHDRRERDLFLLLLTVTGIGPKAALGILSAYEPDSFARVVVAQDLNAVTAVPGVGKKSGQRILLELKDKMSPLVDEGAAGPFPGDGGDAYREATEALRGLGYSASEIGKALGGYKGEGKVEVEDLLRYALRRLGGGAEGTS